MKRIEEIVKDHNEMMSRFLHKSPMIEKAAEEIINAVNNGNKILICGNGGSAAESQHMAAEFVGRFQKNRRALAAIALSTDTSIITSVSNDYSFEEIFSRQVEALGKPKDVLIAMSTSGNSPNAVKAAKKAKELKMKTIALTGRGGKLSEICDLTISFEENITARIQEAHLLAIHIICELVENSCAERK